MRLARRFALSRNDGSRRTTSCRHDACPLEPEELADRAQIQAAQVGFLVVAATPMIDEASLGAAFNGRRIREHPAAQPAEPGRPLPGGLEAQGAKQSLQVASGIRRDALRDRLLA